MKEVQYQNWKQVRAKGFVHYLLVRGILCRGIPFGIAMAVMNIVWPTRHYDRPVFHSMVEFSVMALFFGWLTGWYSWRENEAAFQSYKKDHDNVA